MDMTSLQRVDTEGKKPAWVSLSLWQIGSRRTAVSYAVVSGLLATAAVAYGLTTSMPFLAGGAFYVAAGWYWAAVRWMDTHGAWPHGEPRGSTSALG